MAAAMTVVLVLAAPVQASDGLRTITGQFNVERTMNRLERLVRVAGFRVFARIDHSRAADRVGVRLPPVQLLIFGKPEAGSVLMQSDPRIGIDLPMKFLVWRDPEGRTQISWNQPEWLADRHRLSERGPVLDRMNRTLEDLALQAASE
jgi:uncharacterized protein (DUF302 family)